MEEQSKLALLEATIIEQCDNLTWVVTGIFVLSIFLTILRPDPTLAICLFAFYGAHTRSYGAIRSFWFFTLVTVLVDVLWLLAYSPLRPMEWDTLQQLARKDQMSVTLSVLNLVYKLLAVYNAVQLQLALTEREELIRRMELEAGLGIKRTGLEAGLGSAPFAASSSTALL